MVIVRIDNGVDETVFIEVDCLLLRTDRGAEEFMSLDVMSETPAVFEEMIYVGREELGGEFVGSMGSCFDGDTVRHGGGNSG